MKKLLLITAMFMAMNTWSAEKVLYLHCDLDEEANRPYDILWLSYNKKVISNPNSDNFYHAVLKTNNHTLRTQESAHQGLSYKYLYSDNDRLERDTLDLYDESKKIGKCIVINKDTYNQEIGTAREEQLAKNKI